jgi:predicted Fe-Mo cluster-binding NifX family protein
MIAVPLDENKEIVCVSFGRAPYFLFYNTDTNTSETLINPAADAQGGAGIQSAQFVADHCANALITVRCGQNAAEVLLAAGITVYKAAAGAPAAENLRALAEGKLGKLDGFHPGFHGHA